MKKWSNTFSCCLSGLAISMTLQSACAPSIAAPAANAPPASPYTVSQPYCSNNLAVFLIHGKEKMKGQSIMTLEEALAKKQVLVEETSDVNQLKIQNLSNSAVFLQSGDIVRGGKQDRAVQFDMILMPKSGKVPLAVFCVEHGRWQQRGREGADAFSSSSNQLSGKSLKLAAKQVGDQGAVWNNVSALQGKLSSKVDVAVCDAASPSSFELTMDSAKVKEATKEHINKLSNIPNGQNDVIGYAFAINGKINSADVYASNELFKKLWPKLLKSSAAEAVAEAENKTNKTAAVIPKPEEIKRFLSDAESKPKVRKADNQVSEMSEQESKSSLLYTTRWYKAPNQVQIMDDAPIHKNYISK